MTTSPSPSSSASDPGDGGRRRGSLLRLLPLLLILGACRHPAPAAAVPPAGGSLLDRALWLFAAQDPGLDAAAVRAQVASLAADAAPRVARRDDARGRVEALNRFFFEERGFTSDDDLRNPDNLFPDRVLARRRGYCTGLALLYAAVADRLGLPVFGVNTPAHLFLRYDDGSVRVNIETQAAGREISDETYRARDRIPAASLDRGVFLVNLDDDRFLSQLANNLGTLRSRAGDPEGAAGLYRLAIELDPLSPTARYNLATDRMRQGRLEEAREEFSRALELHPNHVSSLNNRGICRLRLGDVDGAVADFLAALAIDPEAAEVRRNLEAVTGGARP